MRIDREMFEVVPNGGDLPRPSPTATAHQNDRLIVSIGRLERYKGHHLAIEAMPHILRRLPKTRLQVVGEGPFEGELRRLVTRLGLGDHVTIASIPAGDRQAMADLVSNSAVVVLFSEYEAHPVAVMEALSLGRNIVVSDTAGFVELVGQGLVRGAPLSATSEDRANLIFEAIEQPLSPGAFTIPTWDDCVDRLLAVYQDALQQNLAPEGDPVSDRFGLGGRFQADARSMRRTAEQKN